MQDEPTTGGMPQGDAGQQTPPTTPSEPTQAPEAPTSEPTGESETPTSGGDMGGGTPPAQSGM